MVLLKPTVKALMSSSKVSIRTDNRGFLSLQYMIRNEDGQICFVEYYVSTCTAPMVCDNSKFRTVFLLSPEDNRSILIETSSWFNTGSFLHMLLLTLMDYNGNW